MKMWSAIVMYLGVGIILGATIMFASGVDVALGIGGGVTLIAVGIYAFCVWKTLRAQRQHPIMSKVEALAKKI